MLSSEDIRVSKYRSNDEFKEFQCEKKGYSDFVQDPNEALKYYRENLGVTYVFKFKGTPVGFVTLAMASLRKKTCQKSVENRNLSVTCQVFFSATWRETLDSKAKEWAE